MTKLKSERHHWWPECLSAFWKDGGGCAHWIAPDGEIKRLPPKNFGVIGNGHHIKLGNDPAESSPWDQSFEDQFRRADDNFPWVVRWLEGLDRIDQKHTPARNRFLPQADPDGKLDDLIEGLVSLAVRSPMNRESAVSLAEHFRGPLPQRERNALIGLNIRNLQSSVVKAIGNRGKFVVMFSPDREFIFGDGFFNNIPSSASSVHAPKILTPLTPNLAVLFARPMQYRPEPKLTTLVVGSAEVDAMNHAVQVYARSALYYRSEQPILTEAFRAARHLTYSRPDNPIDSFIHQIPGVPPRDTSLDELRAAFGD